MAELETLEQELLKQVAAANDEAAIEDVRVTALGKKGSISELLKTLGTMSPEERKTRGAAINSLKDRVGAAIAARKSALEDTALTQRLMNERIDITLPIAPNPVGAFTP